MDNLSARFDELRVVMRDTPAAEVEPSKALWKGSIAPQSQFAVARSASSAPVVR